MQYPRIPTAGEDAAPAGPPQQAYGAPGTSSGVEMAGYGYPGYRDDEKRGLLAAQPALGVPAEQAYSADVAPFVQTAKLRKQRIKCAVIACVVFTAVVIAVCSGIIARTAVRRREAERRQEATLAYPMDAGLQGGLGPVYYPWGGAPIKATRSDEARQHVSLGLRLLHVFWYDLAREEFKHATWVDPSQAIGYWGIAMTTFHQLWQTEDLATAQQALKDMDARANLTTVSSDERGLIDAARLLFSNATLEQRQRGYTKALADLHAASPSNPDVCAFYGLSLLSMVMSSGDYLSATESTQSLTQARKVLEDCRARWPDHAGLLHYITHASDFPNPDEAAQGLSAGLRLADVATASCHALHMKSHLFLQMGNWAEVVDSNTRAVAASDAFCGRTLGADPAALRACDADDRYHALEWWLYGLLQQCAFDDSRALLGRILEVYDVLQRPPFHRWALRMWSHTVIQSQAYPDIPPLTYALPASGTWSTDQKIDQLMRLVNASSMAAVVEDSMFWELHARASALVAGAYGVTVLVNSSSLGASNPQATLSVMRQQLQQLHDVVPRSQPYMDQLLDVYLRQVEALQSVAACLLSINNSSSNGNGNGQVPPASCTGWQQGLDEALERERRIRDSPAAPSLTIAPVAEMYGHLLLMTFPTISNQAAPQSDQAAPNTTATPDTSPTAPPSPGAAADTAAPDAAPDGSTGGANSTNSAVQAMAVQVGSQATALFKECLARLPHRQSCVLGAARAAALTGNTTDGSLRYGELWAQCAPAAAPPDFLWPGLMEAYFMVVPPANTTTDPAAPPTGWSAPPPRYSSGYHPVYYHHYYYYSYGGSYAYTPVSYGYYPTTWPATTYNSPYYSPYYSRYGYTSYPQYTTPYTPPYTPPRDTDPRNRVYLSSQGYSYTGGTAMGYPVGSTVTGYPAGAVQYDSRTGRYTYVKSGSAGGGYWTPTTSMYSETKSGAYSEASKKAGGSSKSGSSSSSSSKGGSGSSGSKSGSSSSSSSGGSRSGSSSSGGSRSGGRSGSSGGRKGRRSAMEDFANRIRDSMPRIFRAGGGQDELRLRDN